ncbi:hypothetical protein QAD02_023017 [Eretmocerus hayati]|uniref:Uncharacterized protein n=1 Tax=Eretmocerus hayati TaxID=131215 RepID=A0ACC2PW96_9HYME|nr:hypothetical protein QAD02_023017 [Eretmocerus hayati]
MTAFDSRQYTFQIFTSSAYYFDLPIAPYYVVVSPQIRDSSSLQMRPCKNTQIDPMSGSVQLLFTFATLPMISWDDDDVIYVTPGPAHIPKPNYADAGRLDRDKSEHFGAVEA